MISEAAGHPGSLPYWHPDEIRMPGAGIRSFRSNPDGRGIAQVCTIDLKQVWKDW